MDNEINIFTVLDWIRDNAPKYAQAKANRVHVDEFRKSKKAMLMQKHSSLAVNGQEREAYADPEYIELLTVMKDAVEAEETLRWRLEAARLKAEVWRTLEANKRIEAKIL